MKKTMYLVLLISISIFITACNFNAVNNKNIELPDLTGMNEEQANSILSEFDLNIIVKQVVNNDIREGRFVSYNEPHEIGSTIDAKTTITIYFAIHSRELPDLSGMNQQEIFSALSHLNVIIDFNTIETLDIAQGLFVRYGLGIVVGDTVKENDVVTIYLAEEIVVINNGVMISKYLEGANDNRAIELFNVTDELINLEGFALELYINGNLEAGTSIDLRGVILPGESFLIVYSGSEINLIEKADMLSNELNFNGNDAVTLIDSNEFLVDIVGVIGWGIFYLENKILARDIMINEPSDTFDVGDWNQFHDGYLTIIGQNPAIFPTTFTFNSEYLNLDFSVPKGMVSVAFVSNNDGDTAHFTPGFTHDRRVRFVGVDTPETGTGIVASDATSFVYNRLKNATTIYLQHDPSSGTTDSFGRALALIWVDGVLINYELVLYGYSQNNYGDSLNALVFNGVTLSTWMNNAQRYAQENNLGVWA